MIKIKEQKISSLRGSQRVRQRPSVIFGDNGHSGVSQAVFEMVSNSLDECRRGYGNKVTLIKHKDLSYSVIDEGRGIPLDWNESENEYDFQLIFQRLYAGGNYNNDETEDKTLGSNGLGCVATCFSSEFFNVESYKNDGRKYSVNFIKGRIVDKDTHEFIAPDDEISISKEIGKRGLKKSTHKKHSGTIMHFKPDEEVFTEIDVNLEWLKQKLTIQSVFNLGVEIFLEDEFSGEKYKFYYDSIEEYINTITKKENNITNFYKFSDSKRGSDKEGSPQYECNFELGFLFNNMLKSENKIVTIHNSSEMVNNEKTNVVFYAIKHAFLSSIEKLIKQNGGYNTKDKGKINYRDIEDSLVLVINSASSITNFTDQTKLGINNPFIKEMINESIKHHLDIYFAENKVQSEIIMNQVLVNFRARTKAEETKKKIKKKFEEKYTFINKPKKFVNCTSRDKNIRELWITEGDSALGACKLARDSKFQALMPVRGKILNCLKASLSKIFDSEIIVQLIKILGCGVEIKNKKIRDSIPEFDLDKLDYNKIIIATDCDEDGKDIRCLIICMFYRLMPELIINGNLYYVETPLYEITCNKKTYFAHSDKERDNILDKIKGKKCKIERSKGLGENEPEMMWKTTMNPETRKLVRVSMKDADRLNNNHTNDTIKLIDAWMGEDINTRKKLAQETIEEYFKGGF